MSQQTPPVSQGEIVGPREGLSKEVSGHDRNSSNSRGGVDSVKGFVGNSPPQPNPTAGGSERLSAANVLLGLVGDVGKFK